MKDKNVFMVSLRVLINFLGTYIKDSKESNRSSPLVLERKTLSEHYREKLETLPAEQRCEISQDQAKRSKVIKGIRAGGLNEYEAMREKFRAGCRGCSRSLSARFFFPRQGERETREINRSANNTSRSS